MTEGYGRRGRLDQRRAHTHTHGNSLFEREARPFLPFLSVVRRFPLAASGRRGRGAAFQTHRWRRRDVLCSGDRLEMNAQAEASRSSTSCPDGNALANSLRRPCDRPSPGLYRSEVPA